MNGGASVVEPVLVWPKSDWCGVVGKVFLELVQVVRGSDITGGGGYDVSFRKECANLVRWISLLTYMLQDIRDFKLKGSIVGFIDFFWCCFIVVVRFGCGPPSCQALSVIEKHCGP